MKSTLTILAFFLLLHTMPLFGSVNPFPEIKIYISKNQFYDLQATDGDKLILAHPVMTINQDTARVNEIHARGNNSLKFRRKSLSVELDKAIKIENGHEKVSLKKFNLLNLSMDKHLWHNRWSNLNMEALGIFPLFNLYCKVWINDEPQGIFLLVEKPQHAKGKLKSPYMLRRGPNHTISDEYFDDTDKEAAKKYRKQFQSIYSDMRSMKEEMYAQQLGQIINLESYFKYIAFNYLIMNGDYADEVFFYIEPQHNWFEIIPWDFDDILKPVPHEGRIARNKEFAEAKIFSIEESMDRAIAGNKMLYSDYEKTLDNLLHSLDSASLMESTNQVIRELEQIGTDHTTAQVTLFLDREPFDIEEAKKDILLSLDFLLKRRKWILTELK